MKFDSKTAKNWAATEGEPPKIGCPSGPQINYQMNPSGVRSRMKKAIFEKNQAKFQRNNLDNLGVFNFFLHSKLQKASATELCVGASLFTKI